MRRRARQRWKYGAFSTARALDISDTLSPEKMLAYGRASSPATAGTLGSMGMQMPRRHAGYYAADTLAINDQPAARQPRAPEHRQRRTRGASLFSRCRFRAAFVAG